MWRPRAFDEVPGPRHRVARPLPLLLVDETGVAPLLRRDLAIPPLVRQRPQGVAIPPEQSAGRSSSPN